MSDSIRRPCAGSHRLNTGGNQCIDCGTPITQVFYADPVDKNGIVIGTARVWITECIWGDAITTKVPHSELALEDMPTIHVREEDFPA